MSDTKGKEVQPFKAFEKLYNSFQMTLKMYVIIAGIIFLIQSFVVFVYLLIFKSKIVFLVVNMIIGFYLNYFDEVAYLLFKEAVIPYLISTPVWLLFFPIKDYFARRAKEIVEDKHIRGSAIVSDEEVAKQVKDDIAKRKQDISKCYYIGKIPVPPWAENRHMIILGRPGVGKTTLINSILHKLRARNEVAIVHDFKGDYVSKFYDSSKDIIFNPIDARSVGWCILDEVRIESDIDMIAHSLIPPTYVGSDRFWVDAARDVLASVIYYLVLNNMKTNEAMYRYTTLTEGEMIDLIKTAVASGIEGARRAMGYLLGYERGSKIASDTLATMKQYCHCFYYTRHLNNDFNLTEFINTLDNKKGGRFIFVTNYSILKDTLKPLLTSFIDIMMKRILSLHDDINRRIFFILDEFAMLQRMSSIVDLLSQGRSKGACVIIATQDVTQIQKMYSPELNSTIMNCCNTIVSFAVSDVSAEYMSRVMGEREIEGVDESISMGVSEHKDGLNLGIRKRIERTVLASEISGLQDFECYIKMLAYSVTKTRVEKFFLPNRESSFLLNDIFSMIK